MINTVTSKTKAWVTQYSGVRPQDINDPKPDLVNALVYHDCDIKNPPDGWTYIGEAEITVQLVSSEELLHNKVAALRREAANIRAEATMKCTRIEEQISQLLCLEFTPAATE